MSGVLQRPVTVLLTSVGNEAIHGFGDDLRRRAPSWRLVGVDIRDDAAGFARCDHGYLVPRRDDPRFVDELIRICRGLGVDVLLPLSTEDQDFFSRPDVQRRLGLPLVVSDPEAVAAANGKVTLFEAVERGGRADLLPVHHTVDDAATAAELLDIWVKRQGRALLKADRGTGGAGLLCVGKPPSNDPAPVADRRWLSVEQAVRSLGEQRDGWPRQLVSWLPGAEYSVDLLGDHGESLGGVVRLRHAAVGGMAQHAETVDEPDILAAAEAVLRVVDLSYVNNIQFRRDRHGAPKLMEINPRIPGTIGLTVAAGLNLPLAACALALGEKIPVPGPRIGLHVLRHAGTVFSTEKPTPFTQLLENKRQTEHDPVSNVGVVDDNRDQEVQGVPRPCAPGPILLWDLDRTLAKLHVPWELVQTWKAELLSRLQPYGWSDPLSPLLPCLDRALIGAARAVGPRRALALRHELYACLDRWEAEAFEGVTPLEPAIEHFYRGLDAQMPGVIVTSNGPEVVGIALDAMDNWAQSKGFSRRTPDAVIHRHALVPSKPSPAPLQAALATLGRPAGEHCGLVVMVGDSPHDRQAAQALDAQLATPVTFVHARLGDLRPDAPEMLHRFPAVARVFSM